MPVRAAISAVLFLFVLGCHDQAFPDPLSSCTLNPDGLTQTCNLFEGSTETSGPVALISPVTSGFIVLLESDLITWSDIVWFPDNGQGQSEVVTLFSDPFTFAGLPFSRSDVAAGATFVSEVLTDPTIAMVSTFGFDDTFQIFSESAVDAEVPEPSTLVLLLSSLIAIGANNRKRTALAYIKRRPS